MWHRRPRSDQCHLCSSVVKGFVFQLSLLQFRRFWQSCSSVSSVSFVVKGLLFGFFVSLCRLLEIPFSAQSPPADILSSYASAHNRVTAVYLCPLPHEIPALKFKFKFHPLQLPACHLPERLAVGKAAWNRSTLNPSCPPTRPNAKTTPIRSAARAPSPQIHQRAV